MKLEKTQDAARTEKMRRLEKDSVIVGTVSSIMEAQLRDPRFCVYPIESGSCKGDFVVSDDDGNTVIIRQKDYKRGNFNPSLKDGRYTLSDGVTEVILSETEWRMLNEASESFRLRPRVSLLH